MDRDRMLQDPEIRAEVRRDLLKLEAIFDRYGNGKPTVKGYNGLVKASRILLGLSRICLVEIDVLMGEWCDEESNEDIQNEINHMLEDNQ